MIVEQSVARIEGMKIPPGLAESRLARTAITPVGMTAMREAYGLVEQPLGYRR